MRYRDESWLRETYKDHTLYEMAEMEGVSHSTIIRWMNRYEIERRPSGVAQASGPYKDRDWLYNRYVNDRQTIRQIADECDVSRATIRHYLHKYDIPLRKGSDAFKAGWEGNDERKREVGERFAEYHRTLHPFFFTHQDGYEIVGSSDGQGGSEFVALHRLLAVAKYGFDALNGKYVHHRNHVKWDNRPDNIELMDPGEHSSHHASGEPPTIT